MRIDVTYAGDAPRVIETSGEALLSSSTIAAAPEWVGTGLPVTAVMLRPRTDLLGEEGSAFTVEVCAWSTTDAGANATVRDLGGEFEVPRMAFHVVRTWDVLPPEDVARVIALDIDGRIHVRRVGGRLLDLTAFEHVEADLLSATERSGCALDQRVLVVHERLRALHPGLSDEELGDVYGLGGALHAWASTLAGDGPRDGRGTGGAHGALVASLAEADSLDECVDLLADAIVTDPDLTTEALTRAARESGADLGDVEALWAEAEDRIADEAGWDEPDWEGLG